MTPDVVADIGNTRIKWGRCSRDSIVEMASLAPDEAAWRAQFDSWRIAPGSQWVVAGVHPARRDHLAEWLLQRGQQVRVVSASRELPLETLLPEPEKAGIDRLLNAVAANRLRPPNHGAVIVDAGSAVTVDWVDDTGAFAGGAIMPGFRLMAKALHDYTALLPSIDPPKAVPRAPGTATIPAMETGIYWSVAGAVHTMIYDNVIRFPYHLKLFLTGGDSALLEALLPDAVLWPAMTLAGLRLTAETLS